MLTYRDLSAILSNFRDREILRFEQFSGLVILLKRIDKLKFYPLGLLKEITVREIMLTLQWGMLEV